MVGKSSPPLSQPGGYTGLFKLPVQANASPRWLQALIQACEQPRVRDFVSAAWPSCCGPRQPVATELAVVPSPTPRSPSLTAGPARPRRDPSRHILVLTGLRAFRCVPSQADPCAHLPEPQSVMGISAAFLITIGALFLISPTPRGGRVGRLAPNRWLI